MFLHRIHLNPRCKEARRDLADPYNLHATLCRAFSKPDTKCPPGEFLWRLEPETDASGFPCLLIQSRSLPDWSDIRVKDWLANADPAIDLKTKLNLDSLCVGQRCRFRLRANPSVTRGGKRLGLLKTEEQERWIERKGNQHGFSLPKLGSFNFAANQEARIDVHISQEQTVKGIQQTGNTIRLFSVLYDGILTVTNPYLFNAALETGIGHGKALGLGLLSVVPLMMR